MTVPSIAADQDTTANQHGQLTSEQRRRATAAVNAQASPGVVVGACIAFLFGIIIWAGSRSYSSNMGWREYLL